MVQQQNTKEIEAAQAWAEVREAYRNRERKHVLSAQIIGAETLEFKGYQEQALKVYFKGIYGFIPTSLIDDYEYRSLQSFIGTSLDFIVTHVIEEAGQRLFVGDRKKALEVLASKFWKQAKSGQVYDAFVSGVDMYGAYLVIEGVRTRLNRTEYSYEYVTDMRELVFIGDSIQVELTEVDAANQKLEVSRKSLEDNPAQFINEYKKRRYVFRNN